MTNLEEQISALLDIVEVFIEDAERELHTRWKAWEKDLSKNEIYEVVGALLARQVSLATNFARAPEVWNPHLAPIFLRAMADVYITLAWIIEQPEERAQRFIHYGLGQQKLNLEHRKKQAEKDGKNPEDDRYIKAMEGWINTQRYTFLTEVDVGNWAGKTTRQMAEEAGCLAFYNYVYTPFSPAVHSMWNHVARYNLIRCTNPLHRHHQIPDTRSDIGSDPHNLYLAAKYLDKAFRKFDEKMGISVDAPNSFDRLYSSLITDDGEQGAEAGTSGLEDESE